MVNIPGTDNGDDKCYEVSSLTENTLIIYFGNTIDEETSHKVRKAKDLILEELRSIVIDIIPSYTSVHVTYDLSKTNYFQFKSDITRCLSNISSNIYSDLNSNIIELPVYYGGEVALDLKEVADEVKLSPEEVISIHSGKLYTVYAIGFCPGFAYLGNTDKSIEIPRKATPRTKVPAGSLGIADTQTAIYPSESPGGWRILGRTPVSLINYTLDTLTPFQMGDKVRFVPISKSEFLAMGGVI
ncbi:MAG: 5-oxoprolinase subunit PxpB [Candidatus Sedimenticola sp. 6PFRAG7]